MAETTEAVCGFADLILLAAKKRQLKKAVLSKPCDAADRRAELTLRRIGGRDCLQAEKFRADNKALHENLPLERAEGLTDLLAGYAQINLLTAAWNTVWRIRIRISRMASRPVTVSARIPARRTVSPSAGPSGLFCFDFIRLPLPTVFRSAELGCFLRHRYSVWTKQTGYDCFGIISNRWH